MIKTLAAIAALAALPTIASAQGYYEDPSSVTVYGHHRDRDSYSIVIDTAGKPTGEVMREISNAAYEACARAPSTGNIMDDRPPAIQACVTQATQDADAQFYAIRQGYRYDYGY